MNTIKLKVQDIRAIYMALLTLDGYEKIIDQGKDSQGKDLIPRIIRQSYNFSGKILWNISRNISILEPYIKDYNTNRDKLISKITNGETEIKADNKDQIKQFTKDLEEINAQEVDVTLLELELKGLNLDNNSIQPTTLSILTPIILDNQ